MTIVIVIVLVMLVCIVIVNHNGNGNRRGHNTNNTWGRMTRCKGHGLCATGVQKHRSLSRYPPREPGGP